MEEEIKCMICSKKAIEEDWSGDPEGETRCIVCSDWCCVDHWDGNINYLDPGRRRYLEKKSRDVCRGEDYYICTKCKKNVPCIPEDPRVVAKRAADAKSLQDEMLYEMKRFH